jgi:RNA-directed DNA polymerase
MGQVAKRVTDQRVLKLLRALRTAGVMENGLVSPVEEGTPQGGPLSPLLSNLVLDERDRELERRGHRLGRYADDCNIYVRSARAGQRVLESVTRFIVQKLKLRVNREKSAGARPPERKFLGFSFTWNREPKRRLAPQARVRLKQRVRELTPRTRGVRLEEMVGELATYRRGWRGYFGFCQTPWVLIHLDSWIRRRLRSVRWAQGKPVGRRRAELERRGVSRAWAKKTACRNLGPWRLSQDPSICQAAPNAFFDALGLPRLADGP